MKTGAGRVVLNLLLWLAELYPLARRARLPVRPHIMRVPVASGGVALRVFAPPGAPAGVVLHFHGGGWTIGNARMSDRENAALAARLKVTVVSVDYHLALTRSLDEVIAECAQAAPWVLHHLASAFGSGRVVLAGSSAGAHLAAATLIRLRDDGVDLAPIRGALLLYGLYDLAGTATVRAAGPEYAVLDGPTVRRTLQKLTPGMSDSQRRDGRLSPLFADLSGLPPALFLVGERDMLLEDNRLMAQRWHDEAKGAELVEVPASDHAFDRFDTAITRHARALTDQWIAERLR